MIMSDLNVTEGEWSVVKGHNLHEYVVRSDYQYMVVGEFDNKHDAYLLAQAKNMYEQLKSLSELMPFLDEQTHPNIELDVVKYDIDKILNACKPPVER